MQFKKITVGLFGAAMLMTGISTATAAAPAGCESGWVCLYRDDDYQGGQVSLTNSTTAISHLSSRGFNDEADSYYSNYRYDSAWYWDAEYKGERHCMHSFSSNRSFSVHDSDDASSARKFSSATAC